MIALQWAGTVLVMASYWYYVTQPRVAVVLSIIGCVLTGFWAIMLEPAAWGIFVLEAFVTVMGVRNLWKLR